MAVFENAPQCSFCCFCVDLRNGAITIGIAEILVFVVYLRLEVKENWLQNGESFKKKNYEKSEN